MGLWSLSASGRTKVILHRCRNQQLVKSYPMEFPLNFIRSLQWPSARLTSGFEGDEALAELSEPAIFGRMLCNLDLSPQLVWTLRLAREKHSFS